MTKISRCPFEIKGEADGSIIHLYFNEDKVTRLSLIRMAFQKFHSDKTNLSMKFHLPRSLMDGVLSLEELKTKILPYQIEILSCEIEYRLFPFLPYQISQISTGELEEMAKSMAYKFFTAYNFSKAIKSCGIEVTGFEKVEEWITIIMHQVIEQGARNPEITIIDEYKQKLLTIRLDSIGFYPEDYIEYVGEGNDRRNCFGIVTCPLYPENFWRYSKDVIIVLSRMKDFTDLSSEQRRKIREKCNSIYLEAGVDIQDILEDKQPNGLWIPEMIKIPQKI